LLVSAFLNLLDCFPSLGRISAPPPSFPIEIPIFTFVQFLPPGLSSTAGIIDELKSQKFLLPAYISTPSPYGKRFDAAHCFSFFRRYGTVIGFFWVFLPRPGPPSSLKLQPDGLFFSTPFDSTKKNFGSSFFPACWRLRAALLLFRMVLSLPVWLCLPPPRFLTKSSSYLPFSRFRRCLLAYLWKITTSSIAGRLRLKLLLIFFPSSLLPGSQIIPF